MWHCNVTSDSQVDSQFAGQLRTSANDPGMRELAIELQRTLMDGGGRQTRGLQNRLRGAAEASWVGSIPSIPAIFRGYDSQDDSHTSVR